MKPVVCIRCGDAVFLRVPLCGKCVGSQAEPTRRSRILELARNDVFVSTAFQYAQRGDIPSYEALLEHLVIQLSEARARTLAVAIEMEMRSPRPLIMSMPAACPTCGKSQWPCTHSGTPREEKKPQ